MRSIRFADNEIYHIYNRGVEKRIVFSEAGEYIRFIHHLFEFSDGLKTKNLGYYVDNYGIETLKSQQRKPLVNILAFALMPNHFHLLLQQNTEGGISKFMQKLGTGYTMFFNLKNERSGGLFQGKFKAVHVTSDIQIRHVLHYIHMNPLDICPLDSEENEKIKFLKEYKWSSFHDYIGMRNFPSVTQRDEIIEMFGGAEKYTKSFIEAMNTRTFQNDVDPGTLIDSFKGKI